MRDPFRTSSFCTSGGCLGVDITEDRVRVKDVGAADGTTLVVSRETWAAFVAGVKNGEFDVD